MNSRFYEDLAIALSSYPTTRGTTCMYDGGDDDDDDYIEEGEEEAIGLEYEDREAGDVDKVDKWEELACPFCPEVFDVIGLYCHIDVDHRLEAKPGICPVCATKVPINMASHVITQHESILKALCNKANRGVRSRSAIFLLRKELQEKHLRLIKESSHVGSSSDVAFDSMLLSFVHNPQPSYRPKIVEATSSVEGSLSRKSSNDDSSQRSEKRTNRCEFLQGLVLSTILDDL